MSQYQSGTVSVTNASAVVTGSETAWLANVSAGDSFKVGNIDAVYTVGSVDSDTQITLTANWVGATLSSQNYQIVRDFTANFSLYEIWKGDRDWAYHLTLDLRSIDTQLKLQKITPSLHTDDYALTVSDLGKTFRMNAATAITFTLPSVGTDQDGMRVTFVKVGSGQLNIDAADTDYIHDSAAGATIYNGAGQTYTSITLEYCHADTRWYIVASGGTWVTT